MTRLCMAALAAGWIGAAWAEKPAPDVVRALEERLRALPQPAPRKPPPEAKGLLSWDTLAQVSVVRQKDRYVPEFSRELAALERKEVKLQGFMMPLETGAVQKRFLLTAVPSECGFCMPGSAEQIVEVQAKSALKYVLDPIVVSGIFALVRDDSGGLLYRLTEAVMVQQ